MNQITPVRESTKSEQWLIDTFEQNSLADKAYLQLATTKTFNYLLILNLILFSIELFLVNYHVDITYNGQIVTLAVSTLIYFILCLFHVQAVRRLNSNKYSFREGIAPESFFELIFLIIGWSGLGLHSPLASFRCFRCIRYLWYSKYFTSDRSRLICYLPLFYCHLLLQYIEKVRQELFTMKGTKGALTVFSLYFFTAYIFAIVYWHATKDMELISPEGGDSGHVSQCNTLAHCFFIMIKLPFLDGNASDYWKSLLFHHSILANYLGILLGFYFYFTGIILINGLLGIFAGSAFSSVVQEQTAISPNVISKIDNLIKISEQQMMV